MIDWFYHLPQEKGTYLWIDCPDWKYRVDVVNICAITDYRKPEWVEDLRKKDGKEVTIYKNDAGEELVICWSYNNKPCEVWAWAKFNSPQKVNTIKLLNIIK